MTYPYIYDWYIGQIWQNSLEHEGIQQIYHSCPHLLVIPHYLKLQYYLIGLSSVCLWTLCYAMTSMVWLTRHSCKIFWTAAVNLSKLYEERIRSVYKYYNLNKSRRRPVSSILTFVLVTLFCSQRRAVEVSIVGSKQTRWWCFLSIHSNLLEQDSGVLS